jgi:hypothetical protein
MIAVRFKLQPMQIAEGSTFFFPSSCAESARIVQCDPIKFRGFSAAQVHEVGAEQERVPDAPPPGREQHEEEAHREADHERHGVDDLPGRAGVVALDDVVVRGGERHERDQRQRRVEQVRPPQPVPRRLPRPFPPVAAAAAERADARGRGDAVPEAARGRPEAVGEREEDAGGGAEDYEGPGQDAVRPGALAVVGEERGEDGEGEDGGGREEDVEARRAAEDEVEEHDEARVVVLVIVVLVLAWWISSVLASLLNEDLAFFLLRH